MAKEKKPFKPVPIDKGIPVPDWKSYRLKKYPIEQMEVGDSFFVVDGNPDYKISPTAISAMSKRLKPKKFFGIHALDETTGKIGTRVWRIV
jgi:hypothetical protein